MVSILEREREREEEIKVPKGNKVLKVTPVVCAVDEVRTRAFI